MGQYIYIAYLTQAKDFLITYQTLQAKFQRFTEKTNVKYYLLFHCAELTFKSYLVYCGVDINIIRNKIGHNLNKAMNKCITQNINNILNIDNQFIKNIKHMNQYYKTKQFEYPFTGSKTYIEHQSFVPFLEKLIQHLEMEYRNNLK